MNRESPQETGGRADFSVRRIVGVIIAAIVAFAITIFVISLATVRAWQTDKDVPMPSKRTIVTQRGGETGTNSPERSSAPASNVSVGPPQADIDAEFRVAQRLELHRAVLARSQARFNRVRRQGQSLQRAVEQWDRQLGRLLSDEDQRGRRLAASDEAVSRFIALKAEPHLSPPEVGGLLKPLDALAQFLRVSETGLDSEAFSTEEFESELGVVEESLTPALTDYAADSRTLEGLLRSVQQHEPAQLSLTDAIAAHHQRASAQRAARLEQDLAEVQEEEYQKTLAEQDKLLRQQAALKRAQLKLERELVAGQTEEALTEAELIRQKNQEKVEYLKLRQAAMDPAMLSILGPLVTPDYQQPLQVRGPSVYWTKTEQKMGVSLNRLESLHCLEDSYTGRFNLLMVCSYRGTTRPRWTAARTDFTKWSKAEQERMDQVQEHLRKYGKVLVKEGKLAP